MCQAKEKAFCVFFSRDDIRSFVQSCPIFSGKAPKRCVCFQFQAITQATSVSTFVHPFNLHQSHSYVTFLCLCFLHVFCSGNSFFIIVIIYFTSKLVVCLNQSVGFSFYIAARFCNFPLPQDPVFLRTASSLFPSRLLLDVYVIHTRIIPRQLESSSSVKNFSILLHRAPCNIFLMKNYYCTA